MSAINPDAERVPCPHCWAGIGEPCVTDTGYRAHYTHSARVDAMTWYRDPPHLCAQRRADAVADWQRLKRKRAA